MGLQECWGLHWRARGLSGNRVASPACTSSAFKISRERSASLASTHFTFQQTLVSTSAWCLFRRFLLWFCKYLVFNCFKEFYGCLVVRLRLGAVELFGEYEEVYEGGVSWGVDFEVSKAHSMSSLFLFLFHACASDVSSSTMPACLTHGLGP